MKHLRNLVDTILGRLAEELSGRIKCASCHQSLTHYDLAYRACFCVNSAVQLDGEERQPRMCGEGHIYRSIDSVCVACTALAALDDAQAIVEAAVAFVKDTAELDGGFRLPSALVLATLRRTVEASGR